MRVLVDTHYIQASSDNTPSIHNKATSESSTTCCYNYYGRISNNNELGCIHYSGSASCKRKRSG